MLQFGIKRIIGFFKWYDEDEVILKDWDKRCGCFNFTLVEHWELVI